MQLMACEYCLHDDVGLRNEDAGLALAGEDSKDKQEYNQNLAGGCHAWIR